MIIYFFIVCGSFYDTKPVYLLSTDFSGDKWILNHRKSFFLTQQVLSMPFYHIDIVYYNNNNVGGVNIADQLRNVCIYDYKRHRHRRWLWVCNLLFSNSYICYIKFHRMMNSKKLLLYYEFTRKTFLGWIEHDLY